MGEGKEGAGWREERNLKPGGWPVNWTPSKHNSFEVNTNGIFPRMPVVYLYLSSLLGRTSFIASLLETEQNCGSPSTTHKADFKSSGGLVVFLTVSPPSGERVFCCCAPVPQAA